MTNLKTLNSLIAVILSHAKLWGWQDIPQWPLPFDRETS